MAKVNVMVMTRPFEKAVSLSLYRKFLDSGVQVWIAQESILKDELTESGVPFRVLQDGLLQGLTEEEAFYITENFHDGHTQRLMDYCKEFGIDFDIFYGNGSGTLSLMPLKLILEKLRSPTGCPFDREQTHKTLKKHLIEEAYEVVEAIDEGTPQDLCEELGDLLLQVVFHGQIAEEAGTFYLSDVVEELKNKLVRRHPHVFGGVYAGKKDDSHLSWDEIKADEKGTSTGQSVLNEVPKSLPALIRAEKIQKVCRKLGFDWESSSGAFEKVNEEFQELTDAYHQNNSEKIEEELGDLFFALVNLCRFMEVSPEGSLERTNRKFERRFGYIEKTIKENNGRFENYNLEELDRLWDEAKKRRI